MISRKRGGQENARKTPALTRANTTIGTISDSRPTARLAARASPTPFCVPAPPGRALDTIRRNSHSAPNPSASKAENRINTAPNPRLLIRLLTMVTAFAASSGMRGNALPIARRCPRMPLSQRAICVAALGSAVSSAGFCAASSAARTSGSPSSRMSSWIFSVAGARSRAEPSAPGTRC